MADVYRRLPISGKAIPDALYLLAGRRPIASPGGKEAAPDGGNTSTPLPARLAPGRMVAEPVYSTCRGVNGMSAAMTASFLAFAGLCRAWFATRFSRTPPIRTNLRGPLWRNLAWNQEWRSTLPGQALRRDAR